MTALRDRDGNRRGRGSKARDSGLAMVKKKLSDVEEEKEDRVALLGNLIFHPHILVLLFSDPKVYRLPINEIIHFASIVMHV